VLFFPLYSELFLPFLFFFRLLLFITPHYLDFLHVYFAYCESGDAIFHKVLTLGGLWGGCGLHWNVFEDGFESIIGKIYGERRGELVFLLEF
jgi:hypothetical protein